MRMSFVVALALLFISPAAVDSAPVLFPGNGHYYELISVQSSWSGARTSAATYSHLSVIGHLATVTSAAEDSFLSVTFATGQPAAFAWLAAIQDDPIRREAVAGMAAGILEQPESVQKERLILATPELRAAFEKLKAEAGGK